MKKLLALYGFLLIKIPLSSLFAQPTYNFLDTTKLWSVLHYPYLKYPQHSTHFLKLGAQVEFKDTSFYKLLRSDEYNQSSWYNYGLLREDSIGRVFYRISDNSGEGLIYYNEAQAGDTLLLARRNEDALSLAEFPVESIDSINLLGKWRKRYHLLGDVETWIEDIGALSGLIYNWPGTTGGDDYFLLCCHQNDSLIYIRQSWNNCYSINTKTSDLREQNEIVIYPNPVKNNTCLLNLRNRGNYKIDIYNTISELVRSMSVKNMDKIEIILNVPVGVYYFHISDITQQKEYIKTIIIL